MKFWETFYFLFIVFLMSLLLFIGCESKLERDEPNKDTWWMEGV